VGATAAITGGAGSGGGATLLATLAASDDADAAAAALALALALAADDFDAWGPSSEAPAMINAAVPTTTHTPTSTRHTRSATLGFGEGTANEADARDAIIGRWLGSASGA
jgi:hypothetical protein